MPVRCVKIRSWLIRVLKQRIILRRTGEKNLNKRKGGLVPGHSDNFV